MIGQDLHLAYIDPGAGSILVQVVIGTILAAPFVLRRQIGRVVNAIRRREPEAKANVGGGPARPHG